ncbi:hypothetical protein KIPB_000486, partial [Kipferlia bialata]
HRTLSILLLSCPAPRHPSTYPSAHTQGQTEGEGETDGTKPTDLPASGASGASSNPSNPGAPSPPVSVSDCANPCQLAVFFLLPDNTLRLVGVRPAGLAACGVSAGTDSADSAEGEDGADAKGAEGAGGGDPAVGAAAGGAEGAQPTPTPASASASATEGKGGDMGMVRNPCYHMLSTVVVEYQLTWNQVDYVALHDSELLRAISPYLSHAASLTKCLLLDFSTLALPTHKASGTDTPLTQEQHLLRTHRQGLQCFLDPNPTVSRARLEEAKSTMDAACAQDVDTYHAIVTKTGKYSKQSTPLVRPIKRERERERAGDPCRRLSLEGLMASATQAKRRPDPYLPDPQPRLYDTTPMLPLLPLDMASSRAQPAPPTTHNPNMARSASLPLFPSVRPLSSAVQGLGLSSSAVQGLQGLVSAQVEADHNHTHNPNHNPPRHSISPSPSDGIAHGVRHMPGQPLQGVQPLFPSETVPHMQSQGVSGGPTVQGTSCLDPSRHNPALSMHPVVPVCISAVTNTNTSTNSGTTTTGSGTSGSDSGKVTVSSTAARIDDIFNGSITRLGSRASALGARAAPMSAITTPSTPPPPVNSLAWWVSYAEDMPSLGVRVRGYHRLQSLLTACPKVYEASRVFKDDNEFGYMAQYNGDMLGMCHD